MTDNKTAALAAEAQALEALKQSTDVLQVALSTIINSLKTVQVAIDAASVSVQVAMDNINAIDQVPTPTPTASTTPTPSPTSSAVASPTPSPTHSATPTPSTSASASATATPTPSPSHSATPTPTRSATPTPSASASASVSPTPTPSRSATPLPSPTPSATNGRVIPVRKRGAMVIDVVKQFGADNTGKTNTTAKIQAAINALPSDGGTVYVPAGTYLIDAVTSIQLRGSMLFDMHPDAILKAIPNSEPRYRIIQASSDNDLEIRGGQLVGDRDQHTYTPIYLKDGVTLSSLSTHEWGHCIGISGCARVTISNVRLSNGTGDGISVGATKGSTWVVTSDLVIYNVVATNNRRQGLSITNVNGVKVYDSQWLNTNGTSPQCGIDLEPDSDANADGTGGTVAGECHNVLIEGCLISGNASYGLNVFLRVYDTVIKNNHIYQNNSCGAVAVDPTRIQFIGNLIEENGSTGLFMKPGVVGGEVTDNIFSLNYSKQSPKLRATPLVVKGVVSGIVRDLIVSSGSDTTVNINTYK